MESLSQLISSISSQLSKLKNPKESLTASKKSIKTLLLLDSKLGSSDFGTGNLGTSKDKSENIKNLSEDSVSIKKTFCFSQQPIMGSFYGTLKNSRKYSITNLITKSNKFSLTKQLNILS